MGFVEKYVVKVRGHGGRDESLDGCISVHQFTAAGGGGVKRQLTFRVGVDVMKQARWLSGDKAIVAFGEVDGKPAFVLRRSPDGYTLSSGKKKKGECVTCSVKCCPDEKMRAFATAFVGNRYVPTIDGSSLIVTTGDKL